MGLLAMGLLIGCVVTDLYEQIVIPIAQIVGYIEAKRRKATLVGSDTVAVYKYTRFVIHCAKMEQEPMVFQLLQIYTELPGICTCLYFLLIRQSA